MLRDMKTLKDVLLASAILLVIVASRADGQARATLLTRNVPPEAEGAVMALEESREALLEAREAIDAALRRVDETLASLGERPRERSVARAVRAAPSRAPTMDDLQTAWEGFLSFCSRVGAQLSPWGERIARVSSPAPGAKASPDTAIPLEGATPAFAKESEAAPVTPALEAAAIAGPGPVPVEPAPSNTPPTDTSLPDRILGAAGAILRAIDDVTARGAGQDPAPGDRDPREEPSGPLPADSAPRDLPRIDRRP